MWHSVKPCQVIFKVVLYFGYVLAFWASKNSFFIFFGAQTNLKNIPSSFGGLKRIPNILPPGRDIAIHTGCKETHKMSLAYSSQTISNFIESHYAFPAPNKIHMQQMKRFETKIIQLCKVILLTYLRGGNNNSNNISFICMNIIM